LKDRTREAPGPVFLEFVPVHTAPEEILASATFAGFLLIPGMAFGFFKHLFFTHFLFFPGQVLAFF